MTAADRGRVAQLCPATKKLLEDEILSATERERGFARGVVAWMDGRLTDARAELHRVAVQFPTDVLTAKLASMVCFATGELEEQLEVMCVCLVWLRAG